MAESEVVQEPVTLPEPFAELNPFLERWCNSTMNEQYAARLNSSIAEMQPFYEAVKARIEDICEYLDAKAFDEYSQGDVALGRLVVAWVPVAEAVEVFKQPRVPDSKSYWEVVEEPHTF